MEKNSHSLDTNNMIALCHIFEEFKEFENKLLQIISSKYNRDFVFQLWEISKGKFKIGARKAKKFYSENKDIIDIINKYSTLPTFVNLNYDYNGKPNGDLQFFYGYLLKHKEEISKILLLIEKIKELGFINFELEEDLDFTKEIYSAYSSFRDNFRIIYAANLQAIPNYVDNIKYRTLDSNYKMELGIFGDE